MSAFYIYVDDIRKCPYSDDDRFIIFTARTYNAAIEVIDYCSSFKNVEIYIDLDHDLGEEKSGYDIAKYIVENQIPIVGYYVHSMNPIGVFNINQLLQHYGYKRFSA